MPPTRSMPPAKAVKTERTHEENQERAYIAASRRSDRSLEARVESARRASEIHKRRTGRSLRVTEQDVQNEEMYEEEDDDLPFQYRKLTAHLQTGSDEFNRRLSAYLVNHVAMRSALEQSIHESYAQEFPGAPQYHQPMFPSPFLAQQQQQQSMQSPRSPTYRQQPYPSPGMQQGFSLNPHQRSASIPQPSSGSSDQNSPTVISDQSRSASISGPSATGYTSSSSASQNQAPQPTRKPSFPPGSFARNQFTNPMANPPQFFSSLPSYDMGAFTSSHMPSFSTQLPAETQGFLSGTLDPNDPLTSMMMGGSNYGGTTYNFGPQQPIPFRTSNNTVEVTKQNQHQTLPAGLNSTLVPAETSKAKQAVDEETPSDIGNLNENFFDNAMVNETGTGTPGLEGENWDSWINDAQWDVPTASQ